MEPTRVRLILVGMLAFVAFWYAGTTSVTSPGEAGGAGDVAVYEQIVRQLQAGAPYYVTVGTALRTNGYASKEVFNWRPPTLWPGVAIVGPRVALSILVTTALLLLGFTVKLLLAQASMPVAVAGGGWQLGALGAAMVPSAVYMGESWAGVLIALSAVAFAQKRRWIGVGGALAALWLRELAAPVCVAFTVVALVDRRWRQLMAWLAGGAVYLSFYAWHVIQIRAHQTASDVAHSSSWLELRGLPSLMEKAHWHVWLANRPDWCTALALALVVVGIVSRTTPREVRLGAGALVAFFLVAGKSYDTYWGIMAWPIWSICGGYGLGAVTRVRQVAPWQPASDR